MEKFIIVFALIGVVLCHPRRFLDCNNFECSEPLSPVCGSNGATYDSQCLMDVENRQRMCWIGHFNMISKVSDGPCDPTTTVSV